MRKAGAEEGVGVGPHRGLPTDGRKGGIWEIHDFRVHCALICRTLLVCSVCGTATQLGTGSLG